MEKLHEQCPNSIKIIDKGFTEVKPNSFTVLGLPILTREEAYPFARKFRLL